MKFSLHKLKKEAADQLRAIPLKLIRPFQILAAPVYVFFEKNERFVPVKAPLSYFLPVELEKFQALKQVYISNFVERVAPYQQAGEAIRKLFSCFEKHVLKTNKGEREVLLPLSSSELSSAALKIIAPLWGESRAIEPFFLSFFAEEVCGPLSADLIQSISEKDPDLYELALLRSGLIVFWALQLGYVDQEFLTALRVKVFNWTLGRSERRTIGSETDEMIRGVFECSTLESASSPVLLDQLLKQGKIGRKLSARVKKIESYLAEKVIATATVFGEGGICVNK